MHGDNCCPEQRELKDLLESTNLKQWLNATTHENGPIIDLVIIRDDDTFINATIFRKKFSDHGSFHTDIKASKPYLPKVKRL
jgi:hypothetical protein